MPKSTTLDRRDRRSYPAHSTTARGAAMGKVTISIPLVTWRDGRPRYIPGKQARQEGWKGEDLRHGPDGDWFTLDETIAWSERRQQDMQKRRDEPTTAKPAQRTIVSAKSIGHLFAEWFASPRFNEKAAEDGRARRKPYSRSTIAQYRGGARIILQDFPEVWAAPVSSLKRQHVYAMFEELEEVRGISMARSVIASLRACLSYGSKKPGWPETNPAKDLHLPTPEPRLRYASLAEILHLVETADALGQPWLGDMVWLAVITGKRQGDRLKLRIDQIEDHQIIGKSKKRQRLYEITMIEPLISRLKAAQRRRQDAGILLPEIVIDEAERRAYTGDNGERYRKQFAKLRRAAAAGVQDDAGRQIIQPMPAVSDLKDQDLKDTNQTWLGNAGATDAEMAAIADHSEKTAATTREHYLAKTGEQAASGASKLSAWLKGQGVG